jgi:hypothetical protein
MRPESARTHFHEFFHDAVDLAFVGGFGCFPFAFHFLLIIVDIADQLGGGRGGIVGKNRVQLRRFGIRLVFWVFFGVSVRMRVGANP